MKSSIAALLVGVATLSYAGPNDKKAPPEVEPAAEVTKDLERVTKNIDTAIGRTKVIALGTGSTLQIASHTEMLGAEIEIRVDYAADPLGELEHFAGYATGWATAEAIKRSNKLVKGDGYGTVGSVALSLNTMVEADLVAAMPKIMTALGAKGAPSGGDFASAVARQDKMLRPVAPIGGGAADPPSTVPNDGGLHKLLYADGRKMFTRSPVELIKLVETLKPAAIVDVRKRMRAGHVRIAISGQFDAKQIAKLEKSVKAGLAGWKLVGPITAIADKPAARVARTERVEKSAGKSSVIMIGQVLEATDDAQALALDLACEEGGVLKARTRAVTDGAARVSALTLCERTGRQYFLRIAIVSAEDANKNDKLAADTKAALEKVVNDGPTAAEHAAAQRARLGQLDPLEMLGQGPRTGDMLDAPPFGDRAAAAKAVVAVKRADVHAALKALLDPAALVTVIMTP